jgi:hypothetical protein
LQLRYSTRWQNPRDEPSKKRGRETATIPQPN